MFLTGVRDRPAYIRDREAAALTWPSPAGSSVSSSRLPPPYRAGPAPHRVAARRAGALRAIGTKQRMERSQALTTTVCPTAVNRQCRSQGEGGPEMVKQPS
jgi:hypothetical protein